MNHKTLDFHSFLPPPNALQGRFVTVTVVRLLLKSHIPGSSMKKTSVAHWAICASSTVSHQLTGRCQWKEAYWMLLHPSVWLSVCLTHQWIILTSSSCFYFTPSSSVPDLNLEGSSFLYFYFLPFTTLQKARENNSELMIATGSVVADAFDPSTQ